jgi:protein-S-isoprenylcysteine O-methyltransferase Ste14
LVAISEAVGYQPMATQTEIPPRIERGFQIKTATVKIVGLIATFGCWIFARDAHLSIISMILFIAGAPLLQFPITLVGRRLLDAVPSIKRAEWISIFVHYAMMVVLGVSIFPAIRIAQERWQHYPHAWLGIPPVIGQALVVGTGCAALLSVLNLAIRGLGAPFAAKLSSRLATDWMYAWVRNPMGLCTFALLLAVGLRYQSQWFLLLLVLCLTPGWVFFVKHYEERELEIRFGPSYVAYRASTPFLWPRKPRPTRQMIDPSPDV